MASIGAFISELQDLSASNVELEVRTKYATQTVTLTVIAIVFSLLFIICLRRSIMQMAVKMDEENLTPSDFCLMGIYMKKFKKYDPKFIADTVKQKVEEKYDVKVEYVNPVFDIADFFKIAEEHNKLLKKKVLIDEYMKEKDMKK